MDNETSETKQKYLQSLYFLNYLICIMYITTKQQIE
jgi:hypothetical protein